MNVTPKKRDYSVVDVMQTDVYSLSPDTSVESALSVLTGEAIDHVLVVDHGMLAGILSRDDLCWTDRTTPVGDCVMPPVQCVGPETSVSEAAGIMSQNSLSCLAVTVDALLVGIVSKAELDELKVIDEDDTSVEIGIDELCSSCGLMFQSSSRLVLPGVALCEGCSGNVAAVALVQRLQA